MLLTLLCLLAFPASAFADKTVTVNDTSYDPPAVKDKVGATVTWTWGAVLITRSVTSDAGDPEAFNSGQQSAGFSFPHTFNTPGVYGYHDSGLSTQTGTVTIYGSPSVSLTPASSTITRGQSVDFTASAATNPSGGTLTYEWDLDGNGTYETSAGSTQSVQFPNAGFFAVGLRVTDEVGNQATTAATVQVNVPDSDGDGIDDDNDACPSVAAATSNGCPIVPPVVPPAVITAVTTPRAVGVTGALRSGVSVLVTCSDACNAFVTLARGGRSVAVPQTAVLKQAGSKLIALRLASSAKKSLARAKSVKLNLQVVYTDALTRVQTKKSTITLKQIKTYGKLPAIGISDNQPTTFTDPNFQVLKLKYARLVTPWNSVLTEPDRLDAWMQAARANGIRPLVSFEHSRGQVCPGRSCKGPSKAQYAKAWRKFHFKYPWVKDISPWNEVNSATQPTGKRPDLAAAYYNAVRANCRGCTIVAADLLDASNIRRYVASFLTKAKGKPRLWGLHNYTDTNRFRSRGTNALLQTVKGQVWLTETGGVVKFVTQKGVVALPRSEARAKKAMDYMFRLAEKNATRIKRIYVYQWKINNVFDRFDAGIIRPDGTLRPSFDVLSLNASIARKR